MFCYCIRKYYNNNERNKYLDLPALKEIIIGKQSFMNTQSKPGQLTMKSYF